MMFKDRNREQNQAWLCLEHYILDCEETWAILYWQWYAEDKCEAIAQRVSFQHADTLLPTLYKSALPITQEDVRNISSVSLDELDLNLNTAKFSLWLVLAQ